MSRSYLLSDLVEDVRVRYELPSFSSSTYVTQTAVERFVQESIQDLNAILEECYGSDYFLTTSSITASSATTALPAGAGKVRALYWRRGADDLVQILPATVDHMRYAFYEATDWNCPRYKLTGRTLTWLPIPNQSYTVKIVHTGTQANIDSSSNPWLAEAGWAEYVVEDVCRKICEREEKDPSVWMAGRGEWEKRIRSQAPDREDGQPTAIRDTWSGDTVGLSAYALRDLLTREGY